jgi:hypothetical protein
MKLYVEQVQMYVRKQMHRTSQCNCCNSIVSTVGVNKVSPLTAWGCHVGMVFQVTGMNSIISPQS